MKILVVNSKDYAEGKEAAKNDFGGFSRSIFRNDALLGTVCQCFFCLEATLKLEFAHELCYLWSDARNATVIFRGEGPSRDCPGDSFIN